MTGQIVQACYSGLVLGAIYSLMAMGLSLILSGVRLVNLAHGALFTVGGFSAYVVVVDLGAPALLGPFVGFVGAALVGAATYGVVYRPLMRKPGWDTTTLAAGLGVAVLIEAVITLTFSARSKGLPTLLGGTISLPGGVDATAEGLLMAIAGLGILGLLGAYLARARHGVAIRALASQRDGARLVGIDVGALVFAVVVVGCGLAGLAGVLYSSFYFLSPVGGFQALLMGLIVTVIGGLGSVRGTLAGAYLVGAVEAATSTWLGTQWSLPVIFGLIAIFLVVRPRGIANLQISIEPGK